MIGIAISTSIDCHKNLRDFMNPPLSAHLSSTIIIGQQLMLLFLFKYRPIRLNPTQRILTNNNTFLAYQPISDIVAFLKGDGHDKI